MNITNITQSSIIYSKDVFLPTLWQRVQDIVLAPIKHPEMMWIVTPLIIALVLMEIYFGRYKKEELGWNTAVGNSLALLFVSMDLLRYLYSQVSTLYFVGIADLPMKTLIAFGVGFEAFVLLTANFLHVLPKKVAFFISNSLFINLTAYIAIVLVYSNVPFDWYTLGGAVVLYLILDLFFGMIHLVEPKERIKEMVLHSQNEPSQKKKNQD